MKRLFVITLAILMCAAFVGCQKAQPVSQPDVKELETSNNQSANETIADDSVVTETFSPKPNSPTLPEGAITSEEAVDIALKKAELTKSQIVGLWSELDYDDGRLIYEVDFSDGKYDYDCDIDAKSGKVLKYDKEIDD